MSAAPGGNVHAPIFVSEAFAERHGRLNLENTHINIIFTNQSRAVEYAKRLAQDLNLDYDSDISVHPSLENQSDIGSSTMYIAIGIFVAFFMFVGFLLIYNVMYVSVSKDVRFYGLLKSMGTTPKQLRHIVNGQVLTMYLIGLPVGLGLALLISFVLVPAVITGVKTGIVISFSPIIYAGGSIFTLITTYLGASKSAKKAAKVSPIEATRYAGEQKFNLKPRSSVNGKPYRMAWRNIFRERKRALTVMISLFLGITVFMSAMAIVKSMDIAGNINYWYDHDIVISNINIESSDLGLIGMDRGFIDEIAGIPGVSEVREQTLGRAAFDYPQEVDEALIALRDFPSAYIGIIGIDREYMEELNKKLKTPINIDAFERGEIALIDESDIMYFIGDMLYTLFPIGSELYFILGEQAAIPINTKIAGYANIHNPTGYLIQIGGAMEIIMSNTFLESISGKAGVSSLGINVEEGMVESVNAVISSMAKEHGMPMASTFESRREMEEAQFTMSVLGSAISGILALIGIFNFINLISVGLLTRKREFAALESVGMSKKQMRRMLRWEGAIYWIITLTAGVTIGTGISYGLFSLIHNQDPFFFPQFIYPTVPVVVIFLLIILICTITPEICYRSINKNTLVERLREVV